MINSKILNNARMAEAGYETAIVCIKSNLVHYLVSVQRPLPGTGHVLEDVVEVRLVPGVSARPTDLLRKAQRIMGDHPDLFPDLLLHGLGHVFGGTGRSGSKRDGDNSDDDDKAEASGQEQHLFSQKRDN